MIPKIIYLLFLLTILINAQTPRTIHVFVALADNDNQGIVPVPAKLGDGQNPKTNLYWGALYGVKTYFKNAPEWTLLKSNKPNNPVILERILFKHKTKQIYLLADAYDGTEIKTCINDFLKASNGQQPIKIKQDTLSLLFGGKSKLVSYVGHNGLMEFDAKIKYMRDSFNKLPKLKTYKNTTNNILDDIDKLKTRRHELIHGTITNLDDINGVLKIIKLDFNNEIHECVINNILFDTKEFTKLTKDIVNLASKLSKISFTLAKVFKVPELKN